MTVLTDAHTHVFNAGFLPIEGVAMSRGVDADTAGTFADVIERLVERAAPRANRHLSLDERQRLPLYEMLERDLISNSLAETPSEFIASVVDAVPQSDLAALRASLLRVRNKIGAAAPDMRLQRADLAQAEERLLLHQLLIVVDRKVGPVETGEEGTAIAGLGIGSLVRWILTLLIHESRIEKAFSRFWKGEIEFSLRIHHMMDMENHYPSDRVLYKEPEREERMVALANSAAVPLVGFVAFDPFRRDCLDIVKRALDNGFVGVKFYPPNGYKPIGNTKTDIPRGATPSEVNQRNLDFFRLCVDRDTPVFTHCTRGGMESRKGTGEFSNPDLWEQVLDTPGLDRLRLCFGHAGGQEGWFGTSPLPFEQTDAGKVVKLCARPNVYCEFGFFDKLLEKNLSNAFGDRLEHAIQANPGFEKKACFGSDWHMVSVKRKSNELAQNFVQLIEARPYLSQYSPGLFERNLRSYLNRGL